MKSSVLPMSHGRAGAPARTGGVLSTLWSADAVPLPGSLVSLCCAQPAASAPRASDEQPSGCPPRAEPKHTAAADAVRPGAMRPRRLDARPPASGCGASSALLDAHSQEIERGIFAVVRSSMPVEELQRALVNAQRVRLPRDDRDRAAAMVKLAELRKQAGVGSK